MAMKLSILFFVALLAYGHSLVEIDMPEESYTYHTNELIGRAISIPKWWYDTLQACYITFPSGLQYEAYPVDRIPHDTVSFLDAVQPFTQCAIGFRGSAVDLSGQYELQSLVLHSSNDTQSLTKLKVNFEIKELEGWNDQV